MARDAARARDELKPAAGEAVAQTYAAYVSSLRYEDLPEPVVTLAKFCLIDAVGCAVFGKRFPWSQIVLEEAVATGSAGRCVLPGVTAHRLDASKAALVLGAMAHAFELDSLRKPGAGVHPGATVALPALAVAQASGASGRELITAIVAGCEVLFRIGAATLHSPEKLGFHAPGITGVFGSAAASAHLMKLSSQQTANAFGIAGSLAGGLLTFAASGTGGMVKRLHLGRAAESGVVAARLALRGYEGPRDVFEGTFGILDAYCDENDPSLLTKGLGETFDIKSICFKRYACHVTAHAPVQLLRQWIEQDGFGGADIASISMEMSDKVVSHHGETDPSDIMLAQYSVPFTTALAAFYDPDDPRAFSDEAVRDPWVRSLARKITLQRRPGLSKGWGGRMWLTLANGQTSEAELSGFLGAPETPFAEAGLRRKFDRLIADEAAPLRATLFDQLLQLDTCGCVSDLALA